MTFARGSVVLDQPVDRHPSAYLINQSRDHWTGFYAPAVFNARTIYLLWRRCNNRRTLSPLGAVYSISLPPACVIFFFYLFIFWGVRSMCIQNFRLFCFIFYFINTVGPIFKFTLKNNIFCLLPSTYQFVLFLI